MWTESVPVQAGFCSEERPCGTARGSRLSAYPLTKWSHAVLPAVTVKGLSVRERERERRPS